MNMIFWLVLYAGAGVTIIPVPYATESSCHAAGEHARGTHDCIPQPKSDVENLNVSGEDVE